MHYSLRIKCLPASVINVTVGLAINFDLYSLTKENPVKGSLNSLKA